MRFSFPYSHAFPHGRITIDDDGKSGPDCLIEFADSVTVIATWRREQEKIELAMPDYRTDKGTRINAKRWRLTQGPDGIWRTERTS